MRTRITIAARIWLVVALCLTVSGTAIGVLTYKLKATSASYEATLHSLQERVRQQDAARVMQVNFKKQVQEWKDILLRGYNPDDLAKYSGQFRADGDKVTNLGSALEASVTDPDARRTIRDFLEAHAAMNKKYETALRAFTAGKGENSREADQLVKGQDRPPPI